MMNLQLIPNRSATCYALPDVTNLGSQCSASSRLIDVAGEVSQDRLAGIRNVGFGKIGDGFR